ncbi:hypothetical protein [Actinomyces vulturis]|uniref:hypothetical protein n=1 Tax=Actinomyces vulturis TaxID=1857645 RepID=UPI0011475D84|nr:hypothetical protein [Actinomyces vulturis]
MPTVIIRSLPARISTVLIALIALYITIVVWLSDGWGNGLVAAAITGTFSACVWLLWWVPMMRLDNDGIYVRNALNSWTIGWEELTDTRTRWGLLLLTEQSTIPVSAAGRGGLWTAVRRERTVPATREEYLTPSAHVYKTRLDSDDAAHLVELYQEAWRHHAQAEERAYQRQVRLAAKRHQSVPPRTHKPVTGVARHVMTSSWIVIGMCVVALVAGFVMKP